MRLLLLCILAYFGFQCATLAYDAPNADFLTELHQKAESGDISAQANLAVAYMYNAQPPSHPSWHSNACQKCEFWARKAASSGDVGSIYLLGCLQFEDQVSNRDPKKGRFYLFFSAVHGYKLAQEKYGGLLADDMEPDDELESVAFLTLAKRPDSGLTKRDEDLRLNLEKKLREKNLLPQLTERLKELREIIQKEQSRPLLSSGGTLTESDILNRARELGAK